MGIIINNADYKYDNKRDKGCTREPIGRALSICLFTYPKDKKTETVRKKNLSFAGTFSDMSRKDYADFLNQTKKQEQNFLTTILIYKTIHA